METLERLDKGTVLEILADCPQSFRSVPEELVKAGYEMVEPPKKIGPTPSVLSKSSGIIALWNSTVISYGSLGYWGRQAFH